MGRTRLHIFSLGSLATLCLLVCTSVSQMMDPGEGHPQQQLPGQGHPQQQLPGQGHPQQFPPGNGHPQQFPPGQGHPQQFPPGQGHPQQQHPGQGHPQQFPPGNGHQQQFPPGNGHPQQFPPGQGHPQEQHPGHGLPQQQHPGHGLPQQQHPGHQQQQFPQQQQQFPPQQQQFPPQQQQFPPQQQAPPPQQQQAPYVPVPTPTELKIEVVSRPQKCAKLSKKTDLLTIHYVGKLAATGVEFDNSRKHPRPFKFQLGAAAVIRAWEEGLKNMCIGEIRKLIVPPHMGYGDRAIERIPAKSTLLFEIELMNIETGEKIPNVFRLIDINGDQLLSKDEVKSYIDTEATRLGMQKDTDNSMLSEIFKQEDKNLDGHISHDEFSGPKHDEL